MLLKTKMRVQGLEAQLPGTHFLSDYASNGRDLIVRLRYTIIDGLIGDCQHYFLVHFLLRSIDASLFKNVSKAKTENERELSCFII